jgi:hypothetical protein
MVRTGDGKTIVSVQVAGLTPGATYGSHVHNQSCADGNAGGHYSFGHPVVGGAGSGNSEIWPGPFTANAAGHAQWQGDSRRDRILPFTSTTIHLR